MLLFTGTPTSVPPGYYVRDLHGHGGHLDPTVAEDGTPFERVPADCPLPPVGVRFATDMGFGPVYAVVEPQVNTGGGIEAVTARARQQREDALAPAPEDYRVKKYDR